MSNKNTYYIFRHGETFASKADVDYKDREFTAEILPEAVHVVERLAEYLKEIRTDFNLTSEFLRCRQTAEIVSRITGKEFAPEPLVNEYLKNFGESFFQFRARMKKAVEKFEARKGVYLICTHGAVISALKYLLSTGKYEEADLMDYPRTGTLLIISGADTKLLDFN